MLLKPNFTLGILGGGQLGRMSAMAAARLGIATVIFCPEPNTPAADMCRDVVNADYNDRDALHRFADMVDVISYEFENIPIETIDILTAHKGMDFVLPSKALLEMSQDRSKEKSALNAHGIRTAPWADVSSVADVDNVVDALSLNGFIIKTARFGYDGKGQIKCDADDDRHAVSAFFAENEGNSFILEGLIDFSDELSVIIARGKDGTVKTYGPMHNEHRNHILHKTTIPAQLSDATQQQARDITQKIADSVDLVGVLTVEFFLCRDGSLLVNEIAPRTHNSGHWTIDACPTSQFENHVRAVCGLPLGDTTPICAAEMINLIGDDVHKIEHYFTQPNTHPHFYGKHDVKAGRKMGHVTILKPNQ